MKSSPQKPQKNNILILCGVFALIGMLIYQRDQILTMFSRTSSNESTQQSQVNYSNNQASAPIDRMDPNILKINDIRMQGIEECGPDITTLCKDTAPFKRIKNYCLLNNFEKVSFECKAKLFANKNSSHRDQQSNKFSPATACLPDYKKLCPNIGLNQVLLLYICHVSNWDKLSKDCKKETHLFEEGIIQDEFVGQVEQIQKCLSGACEETYLSKCTHFHQIDEPGRASICLLNEWPKLSEACKVCTIKTN